MKLDALKRTMLAMAEMDLESARRLMGIAETMAEMYPKKDGEEEIDMDRLRPQSYEVQLPSVTGYVSVRTIVAPTVVAQSLPAYKQPSIGVRVN